MLRFSAFLVLAFVSLFAETAKSGKEEFDKLLSNEEAERRRLSRAERSARRKLTDLIRLRASLLESMDELASRCPVRQVLGVGQELGGGTYGAVKAVRTDEGSCAAKIFRLRCKEGVDCEPWCDHYWEVVEDFKNELDAMLKAQGLSHIISVLGCLFPDGTNPPVILMPLMDMDLDAYLKLYPKGLPSSLADRVLLQLTTALVQLHSRKLVHCDLKPQNIFLKYLQIIIGDLGAVNSSGEYQFCTRWYRPLELEFGGSYNSSIDIFSLGCIFFQVLTGVALFPTYTTPEHIRSVLYLCGSASETNWPEGRTRPRFRDYGPQRDRRIEWLTKKLEGDAAKYIGLISEMLALDPKRRLSARQILETLEGRERAPYSLSRTARGMHVVDVKDDGDCAFHAVSKSLIMKRITRDRFVRALKSLKVRRGINPDSPEGEAVAAAIQNVLPEGFDPGPNQINIWTIGYDIWVEKLADGVWLSHADLAVMAFLFDFTLIIHTFGFPTEEINPGQTQTVHIAHVSTLNGGPFNHYVALENDSEDEVPVVPVVGPSREESPPEDVLAPVGMDVPTSVAAVVTAFLGTACRGVRDLRRLSQSQR